MSRPSADQVTRVACIGTGTIGGAWAAHFLRGGYQVRTWDALEGAGARLRCAVERQWSTLEALGLSSKASLENLVTCSTLESAVEGADFVQESVPENIPTKIEMLGKIDAVTPAHVVIASSTSGFSITDMQTECRHPERTIVGHPFHPVYMIPLVEVALGQNTREEVAEWCMAFYRASGKSPVQVREGVHGFIANRLQQALWNEALHMVAAGEASVADIDRAMSEGPGLRWALMGPSFTFHLAGGPGGIGEYLDKFLSSLYEPYSRLAAPRLDAKLRTALVEGCAELGAGKDISTLSTERDEFLIAVLQAKVGRGPT